MGDPGGTEVGKLHLYNCNVIFRQLTHDDLGCASYLIGDEDAGVAAVVDPRLDIDEYLRLARYMGVRIEHVLETHNHADHVSGHGRLAAATGARVHIHRAAAAEYPHRAFDDGWSLQLGSVLVRALHTPGHRPEHTSFALVDTGRGPEPWAVLSGDRLFVGDVARPDLAVDREEGARSCSARCAGSCSRCPTTDEVWPAHIGGSLCGGPRHGPSRSSSTIGFERAAQRAAGLANEDEFVAATTAVPAPQPPNFRKIVALNRGRPRWRTRRAPDDAAAGRAGGGSLVIDVRTALQFDEAHVPGVVSPHPAGGLRLQARVARRPRPADRARRPRRRRRARGRRAGRRGRDRASRATSRAG